MTRESCIIFCGTKGFIHASVEYSSQCFCGNDNLSQATNATTSNCSYSCAGNSTEACGGSNRLNVFMSIQTVTSPMTNPSFGLWALYGCYK
ncbi:hypothetical protein BDZ45DRAFT_591935 [Acephala macrosclerotiorum]|nr:hypothetical protein BDZ45DRAFT_591935 [Acephala macrosclerotiorum]